MVNLALPIPNAPSNQPIPFIEHPLQHRAQAIHLHQTRPLPSSRCPTISLPPGPNICLPHLLLPHPRLVRRPGEIRAQPLQKRKSLRAHRVLPLRTAIFPRAIKRAPRTNRRCTDERQPARASRTETTPHQHARKPLLGCSDCFRAQRTQSVGAQRRKWKQPEHEQWGLHARNTCVA